MEKIFERNVDSNYRNSLSADYQSPEANFPPEMAANFAFSDKSIRHGFIKKVYSILALQLLFTFGFVMLFLLHESVKNYFRAHNMVAIVMSLGAVCVCLCIMVCCKLQRNFPLNYILLFTCTLAHSFFVATFTTVIEGEKLLIAIGVCIVVCLVLTLFALQTKWDFTIMTSVLLVSGIVLFVLTVTMFIFPNKIMYLALASMWAIFFAFLLICDTQKIMGGKHRHSVSPEEYIFGALDLYMDIVTLFVFFFIVVSYSTFVKRK